MATVRVISGQLGGRRISVPNVRVDGFRPATDRAKEAMFSTLESMIDLNGASVLELYAGTGSLGIEALSRGAKACDFVEREKALCAALRNTLSEFGIQGSGRVHCHDVSRLLAHGETSRFSSQPCDLIIAGPPFALDPDPIIRGVAANLRLTATGVFAIVTETGSKVPEIVECSPRSGDGDALCLILKKDKTYGDTSLRYYMAETTSPTQGS